MKAIKDLHHFQVKTKININYLPNKEKSKNIMQNTQPTEKYKIILFTQQGLKTEIYSTEKDLKVFESEMVEKYGNFIMQSSNLITN